jgi:hypothetical protein
MRLARRCNEFWPLLIGLLAACSSRAVPSSLPESSAASSEAPEARPHRVTQALSEEPPLPGPASDDWRGLRAPAAPSGGQHQHHRPPTGSGHEHGSAPDGSGSNAAPATGVSYVCPMHADVVSSEPGRCPRCGMALVKRP